MSKVEACINIVRVIHYMYIEGLNLWAYFEYAYTLVALMLCYGGFPSLCTHFFYGFSMSYWCTVCDVMLFEPPTENFLDLETNPRSRNFF